MPKKTFKIKGFHGGINSNTDPRDISDIESPSLVDVKIDNVGRLKTLGGVGSSVVTEYHSGTSQTQDASAGNTFFRLAASGASAADDYYNGLTIEITSGTNSGEKRLITDYDAADATQGDTLATVSPAWSSTVTNSSVYKIYNGTSISSSTTPVSLPTTRHQGLFVMKADRNIGGALTENETLTFFYSNDTDVDILDNTKWRPGQITFSGTGVVPVFYSADGVVRISDATFTRESEWFGYIANERFDGLNGDSAAIGWHNTDQSLATPTAGKCLISVPYESNDSNGPNSPNGEYIGNVYDGTVGNKSELGDANAVNLRVGVQYSSLLPNGQSSMSVTNGAKTDVVLNPYPFLGNNVLLKGDASSSLNYSYLEDSLATDDEYTINEDTSFAVALFITSGRQYDDLREFRIYCGHTDTTGSYQWIIQKNEINPDCWNVVVCSMNSQNKTGDDETQLPEWGGDFNYWRVSGLKKTVGNIDADPITWQMSGPFIAPTSPDGYLPGVYTFYYSWLYDEENKQESLPYKLGDLDKSYSGEHEAADHSTVLTDGAGSFTGSTVGVDLAADGLIGRIVKNTTDGSEAYITDNNDTTVTVSALLYGSDNSWDDSGDDNYEIPQTNVNKISIVRNPCLFNFDIYTLPKPAGTYGLNKRISGSRIYYKVEENDNFFLIGELDFVNKDFKWLPNADVAAYSMTNTSNTTGNYLGYTALVKGISPNSSNNIDTYKSINGFSSEVASLDAQFKTAVVHGRRTYIGNVKQNGVQYPDRILKSQINKFDTFPEKMGNLDVAIRDGESIVKLEAYADRILQFKQNSLYIINVSDNVDFLEDTYRNKGCIYDYHVVKTDIGISWFNIHGVYLYDGQKVTNLLEKDGIKLISEADWEAFITDVDPSDDVADDPDMSNAMIGYLPKTNEIIIKNENLDVHVYSFLLRSWTKGSGKITVSGAMTNFALNADQDLFYIDGTSSGITKWSVSSANTSKFVYESKDIDFGEPGVRKKIYKVYISYKGNGTHVQVHYGVDGLSPSSTFNNITSGTNGKSTGIGSNAKCIPYDAGTTDWLKAELKPSSSVNNINSFRLKISADDSAAISSDFEINDITIIYRLKSIR